MSRSTAALFGRGSLVAALVVTTACAAVLGIDEKHFDGDAGALVDAVASVTPGDANRSAPVEDAAPRETPDVISADAVTPIDSGGAGTSSHDAAPAPVLDAAEEDTAAPQPVADAAAPVEAAPPPPPSCASTCQPANVVTVLCIPGVACTYDVCAPFPGGGAYLDCDGDRTNGCESSPDDPATCGSCTNACQGNHMCAPKDASFMCKGGGPGNGN